MRDIDDMLPYLLPYVPNCADLTAYLSQPKQRHPSPQLFGREEKKPAMGYPTENMSKRTSPASPIKL
ncbi:hypothetical protein [Agrobacterium pusense]|uniref:hypothetical protein n=1 Tax=Agrobacterium pusense TaxID=648995 RepID=UPI002414E384|nr:hypothetical protein [Agrobacterium pusense]WFN87249.1 hypothetical protein P9K39_13015 [Agrobacterium pusense]